MNDIAALLQLADAAFPAGSFSHSFGLETAIVDGRVHDVATASDWIETYLLDACATLDGAAMALFFSHQVTIAALDERLCAAQPNAEIRQANAHLARATLDTYIAMGIADQPMSSYRATLSKKRSGGIHALAAALGYRAIGAAPPIALEAHATTIVSACTGVAARAIPLGQRHIARMRWMLRAAIGRFVDRAMTARTIDDLCASAVGSEIDGLRHRRLPARLFAS